MFFKDVIGHEEIKQRLITSLQTGRISHAQLFSGDTGAGSLALALAFTQYLFCTGDKHEDACGVCPECKKMQKLIHPDLHFVFPVVKSAKIKTPISDEYINEWRNLLLKSPYIDMEEWLGAMGADEHARSLDIHRRKREHPPKTQPEILRIGLQGHDHLVTRKDENGMFQQTFKDIGRTLSKHVIPAGHRTRRGNHYHDSLADPTDQGTPSDPRKHSGTTGSSKTPGPSGTRPIKSLTWHPVAG